MTKKQHPDIILITTDQQRFDTLGINGANVSTPNIDRLASQGINFSNAFVQNTVCVPSRACIQTGRYPHQHGVTYMESIVDNTPGLPENEVTFMEYLQQHGYRTGAVGKIHMYPEKGFDWDMLTGGKGQRWLQPEGSPLGPGPLGSKYAGWLNEKRAGAYEKIYTERCAQDSYRKLGVMDIPLSNEEYIESWIAENAINFISSEAQKERPFFLWCGFCGPHGPFDPPEPYQKMYGPKDMPLPPELPGLPSWREKWDEELMRRCIAYYRAMVSCIDHHVGEIAATLKRLGTLDDTMIIYTSDHGEMLGERGCMGKGVFYDSVLRVPMWICPPVQCPHRARVSGGITEVMNIAPTILDYAGVTVPENISARSLRPEIEGRDESPEAIFSEYVSNDRKEYSKCVRTATHKYIRFFNSGKEEYYDLVNDPNEQYNLAQTGEQREIMLKLRAMIK